MASGQRLYRSCNYRMKSKGGEKGEVYVLKLHAQVGQPDLCMVLGPCIFVCVEKRWRAQKCLGGGEYIFVLHWVPRSGKVVRRYWESAGQFFFKSQHFYGLKAKPKVQKNYSKNIHQNIVVYKGVVFHQAFYKIYIYVRIESDLFKINKHYRKHRNFKSL